MAALMLRVHLRHSYFDSQMWDSLVFEQQPWQTAAQPQLQWRLIQGVLSLYYLGNQSAERALQGLRTRLDGQPLVLHLKETRQDAAFFTQQPLNELGYWQGKADATTADLVLRWVGGASQSSPRLCLELPVERLAQTWQLQLSARQCPWRLWLPSGLGEDLYIEDQQGQRWQPIAGQKRIREQSFMGFDSGQLSYAFCQSPQIRLGLFQQQGGRQKTLIRALPIPDPSMVHQDPNFKHGYAERFIQTRLTAPPATTIRTSESTHHVGI